MFEVLPGVWSAIVYVENPNTNVDAIYLPYAFTIFGDNNQILIERKSATILPKNRTTGIFEGNINIPVNQRPRRALFEIGADILWQKNEENPPDIKITHTPILRLDTAPRVEAIVRNNDLKDLKNIEFVIAIFDGSGNAIGASRTFLDEIKRNQSSNIFFTWPKPFDLPTLQCDNPSDVILAIDRSGSMSSEGSNPPEPLTSARSAAVSFVEALNPSDKVGIVSFATSSKEPIDSYLTSNFDDSKKIIENISIENGTTQYTNIFDAVRSSSQELTSIRSRGGNVSRILVLLTDGVANNPRNPEGGTESDDILYAESLALEEASKAKREDIKIFTIGLGGSINEEFLKKLASSPEHYYFAPTSENLKSIYQSISSNICQEKPAVVDITYRVFGSSI